MKLLSSLLITVPMSVCLSKVLIVVLRWKSTEEQHRHRPRSPSSSWPLGRGIQELSSEQHTLGQALPQVTISKPYKGFFPSLAFMFQGTAFFKLLSAWNLEDMGLASDRQQSAFSLSLLQRHKVPLQAVLVLVESSGPRACCFRILCHVNSSLYFSNTIEEII